MTKSRVSWLLAALAALALAYVGLFTDWFQPEPIHVTAEIRTAPGGRRQPLSQRNGSLPVVFSLDGPYRLTSLKVVTDSAGRSNQPPEVLWHVVAPRGSEPTHVIIYGRSPKGMQPATEKAPALRLKANVPYRLLIESGRHRGEVPFQTKDAIVPEAGS
jgi:hypothetical protein